MNSSKVILVVDDKVTLRNVISKVLYDDGYDVLVAADGQEALELSRSHDGTIDLLVTDVSMPHMDGISAYQQIRVHRAGIKVLFISGSSFESLTLPDGASFLSKPFPSLDALRNKVQELLEAHSPDQLNEISSVG